MAQLKDSIITGDLRVTGTIYGNTSLNNLADADDLKAIEVLSGTSGWLKKTAANTWALGTFAASDIPNIDANKITSGTLPIARGGTGATTLTANRILIGNDANAINVGNISYTEAAGSQAGTKYMFRIWGSTYGNTAGNLVSQTAGVFCFGDPGPQIQFSSTETGGQQGSIIFTDNDSAATGVSWHFVTDQGNSDTGGNATVTAPRFRARAGLTVGQNSDNTSYNFYVNGTSYFSGNANFGQIMLSDRLTMTSGKPINQILTGSGTAGKDAGANASPRYFPAKWTFNTGLTVSDGDIFTIKTPIAGHSYGVFMSVNNGTNYYPIILNTTEKFTTHYVVGTYIQVIYESSGQATSITPLAGADEANKSTVTGGAFRVLNFYNTNTTYSAMSVAEIKAGTATSSRTIRADYLKSAFTAASDGVFKTGSANGTISVYGTDIEVKGLGSAAYTASTAYATSGHTHTTTIATSTGTNQLTLAFGTKYAITAGGTSYIFTTPADPNTDTAVLQTETNSNHWRKVLVGYQYDGNPSTAVTSQTNQAYVSSKLEFKSQSGTLKATEYSVDGNATLQYNSTTESLDFVF